MRLVFAGTPEPAVPSLRRLVESGNHDVVAVVTRPDAVAGRGRKQKRSPVGVLADEMGIPVLTPRSPSDPEFVSALKELEPDCCPVVAFGALLPPTVLAIPRYGWINLHFSLLPAWRGAAPVQAAIRAGDDITGASTFLIDSGLDTGPVFGVVTETVRESDTAGELLGRLSETGAALLEKTMDGIADGSLSPVPQPADGSSYAGKITVDAAHIDWHQPAYAVDRHIRAMTPEPGAWTLVDGLRMKVGPVMVTDHPDAPQLAPGGIAAMKSAVFIGTATAAVRLGTVQPQGKKAMAAADWSRGARLTEGTVAQ
ncbi:methionyl-tRNA formyltransferase [Hoyosella subflava]|uniref:Methionyl-tRNA formyltransferase n=1 Tax=Hoyosella subflava (strain DSM 45089 / JCM 17490 / NBRC 109087 / DQS3-9A1) TaxID=443218 RepID=F6EMG0_HOYSD|nr:methionyl-tRNA formyltransferase [Hoyosella subflava]AEF40320.1 Methionyl-tRNA formyltransferase [Hoyosella subflava DQS3-9A1]